jgi:hypothetical protein
MQRINKVIDNPHFNELPDWIVKKNISLTIKRRIKKKEKIISGLFSAKLDGSVKEINPILYMIKIAVSMLSALKNIQVNEINKNVVAILVNENIRGYFTIRISR